MLPSEHRPQGKNRPYANDPFKKLSITEDTLKPLYELYYKLGIEAKSAQGIIKKQLSRATHL